MAKQRTVFIADLAEKMAGNADVWDALWRREKASAASRWRSCPAARLEQVKEKYACDWTTPPRGRNDGTSNGDKGCWTSCMRSQLACSFPATIARRRPSPGSSIGSRRESWTCSARVEEQPDGNCFAFPLPADPSAIDAVQANALETSAYWARWSGRDTPRRHARQDSFPKRRDDGAHRHGQLPARPDDFLEWVYTHPDTVHRLLEKITDVIVRMTRARLEAAGGVAHSLHFACLRGGFDLCSEVRSLVSRAIYEEFEAPYLRRIGEAIGAFGVHSCGSWERTIPSVLENPRIRAMNGQIKENNLEELCRLADGKIALSIGPSVNVHACHTWPDMESFYRHILKTTPDSQPFEVSVEEEHLPLWNRLP